MAAGESSTRKPSVDEQVKSDRLSSIKEARDELRKVRNQAHELRMMDRLNGRQAVNYYWNALQSFLLELRSIQHDHDDAQEFWSGDRDNPIGGITVSPPPKKADVWEEIEPNAVDGDVANSYSDLENKVVAVWVGLDDVITSEREFEHIFTYNAGWVPNKGKCVRKATVTATPSWVMLDTATAYAFDFAQKVGLEITNLNDNRRGLAKY